MLQPKANKENVVAFEEVNCSALYCLPISDVTLSSDSLPTTINVKGYDGSIESKIQIEDVSYVYDKSISPQLKITISGTKTYGAKSSSYVILFAKNTINRLTYSIRKKEKCRYHTSF